MDQLRSSWIALNLWKGKITNWDIFNEPLHGAQHKKGEIFVEAFGEGIWNEVLERVKKIDPEIQTSMNDYELGRADLGRCFNKYTGFHLTYLSTDFGWLSGSFCRFPVESLLKSVKEKANYDITGIQSHMKSGVNGHFLKNRFDTIAESGSKFYSLFHDTSDPFWLTSYVHWMNFILLIVFYFRSSTLDDRNGYPALWIWKIWSYWYGFESRRFGRFYETSIFSFQGWRNHYVEMALEWGLVSTILWFWLEPIVALTSLKLWKQKTVGRCANNETFLWF